MRPFRSLAIAAPALLFVACLGNDTITNPILGTPIDCETLATTLAASEPTLTTTASGLKYRDQLVGTGPTVAAGQRVAVRYSGCLTDGTKFDERNDAAPALLFTVSATPLQVIPGFDEGVIGMKVGGRRQLVIPPALGYGNVANGEIPPNSTLVFTVDLVATQ
ncbi:MAG TPA: FKBP-type peptidyl-prolyl cis-trans isomerase [Gemmatimonadaceae bacterium]|jgi:FKBP-type peptidyl-prolyl cis-trans isomerase|nr:FKBP-type peptidyl-prolyl cis-trans isomerase [Gemmatimonadaceae bacterium]